MSLTYEQTGQPIAIDKSINKIISYSEDPRGPKEASGDFDLIPDIHRGFETIFIFGPEGVGKSYMAAEYCLQYRRLFPKNNIYMFSQKDSDPSYEVREKGHTNIKGLIKMRRIKIDDSFLSRDIDILKEFRQCLIVFDDFLVLPCKQLVEKLNNILLQVITLGRSNGLYCLITSHLLYNPMYRHIYQNIHNELHKLIFFRGMDFSQLMNNLKTHWGITPRKINKLINYDVGSRYIILNRFPAYIMSSHNITLI